MMQKRFCDTVKAPLFQIIGKYSLCDLFRIEIEKLCVFSKFPAKCRLQKFQNVFYFMWPEVDCQSSEIMGP